MIVGNISNKTLTHCHSKALPPKMVSFMFSVKGYIVLVDDTGRIICEDKSSSSQPILDRLNIPVENRLNIIIDLGRLFNGAVRA
jgi:hypothetical protein